MERKKRIGTYLGGIGVRCVVFAAIAVLFLLLYSTYTTPLTLFWGGDSAFFVLVGEGMTKGMLPYRDFFDMKGPYLFLIEYIGQLFCYGKIGALLMQCAHLFVDLWIIAIICRVQLGKVRFGFVYELLCIAAFLLMALVTFNGGNLTEEYSLPWLLLAVLFALLYLKKSGRTDNYRHPLWMGFYYGFAFGILAMIRVTNAAIIGAIILTISVGLLVKKEWKNLLANGAAFILGCGVAFAPACIYFACQGLLDEMLSQVFGFGVLYAAEAALFNRIRKVLAGFFAELVIALLPVLVLAAFRVKNWRYWLLSVSAFAIFLAAVLMGNVYLHYFILGLPNFVLGLGLLLEELKETDSLPLRRWNGKKAAAIVLTVLVILLQWPMISQFHQEAALDRYNASQGVGSWQKTSIQEIKSYIPEADYDSVYAYGMASCSNWYVQADLFPCHRYCDWQEHYIQLNPAIGDELTAWLASESPKWVVVPADYTIAPAQIADVVSAHYHEFARNREYVLYIANSNTEK